jgi:hypothetical protein
MESAKQKDSTSDAKVPSKENAAKDEQQKEKKSGGFFKRLFGK